jgi:hypothetical protein
MALVASLVALVVGHHHDGCRTDACERRVDRKEHLKTVRKWRRVAHPFRWWLARVRFCESRNDYGAIDPTGTYTGAYQFDDQTWASVGGTTARAMYAEPAEQDYRAVMLRIERGVRPWPVCG